MEEDIKLIAAATGIQPSAADHWLMFILLLAVVPWNVPWYVWGLASGFFAAEKTAAIYAVYKFTQWQKRHRE